MKFSNSLKVAGVISALAPLSASAFVATFPLGTYAPGGDVGAQIAGKDGWNLDGDSLFNVSDPRGLSYSNFLGASLGAELGGYYGVADPNASVYLWNTVAGGLEYTSLSLQFAIQGSNELNPGRDAFGFSFRDSLNNNLFTISLVPVASLTNDTFQVRYTVGANPTLNALDVNNDPMYIGQDALYSLNLSFLTNGLNPTFSATIVGTNSATFTGTATGLGASSTGRFGMEWNLDGDGANNGLIVDNITVVPEPSSMLLLGLAGLGLVSRRKRA